MIFRDSEFGQPMNWRTAQYRWATKLLLAVCFFAPTVPVRAEPLAAMASSDFSGKVLGTDGLPAVGVEVLTYHLATAELFSATTDGKGAFTLAALPYGYFDLAARAADGLYAADQVANVSAGGKNVIKLRLQPFNDSTQADLRAFPGADEIPVGLAHVISQQTKESFWRSPKGVAILRESAVFSAGGVLAMLVFGGGSNEPSASPFSPGG
jgi:hypothetical protein